MRERIRRNVGLGMAVILLVSSLGVPPASAGTVREGKSLAEAEMDVRSGPVEYNGSEQKPKVSIHLDGVPLREGVDYRLSYADNLDAGTAVVMATGTGAYHGSREALPFCPEQYLRRRFKSKRAVRRNMMEQRRLPQRFPSRCCRGTRWRCAVQRPMTPVSWAGKKRSRCLDCTLVARMGTITGWRRRTWY